MTDVVIPNWLDPAVIQNPFPHYAALQKTAPVAFDKQRGLWIASSYEACHKILRDPRFTNDRMGYFYDAYPQEQKPLVSGVFTLIMRWIAFRDGKEHEIIRNALVRAISMQAQRGFQSIIEEEIDRFFGDLKPGMEVDLLRSIAYPFPLAVICRILGLDDSDTTRIRRWVADVGPFIDASLSLDNAKRASAALDDFMNFVRPVWEQRKKNPGSDLISTLTKLQVENPILLDEDILANLIFIFLAGHETSSSLLTNGVHLIWSNPEQTQLLRQNRDLLPTAVEEVLRFDSPVQRVARALTEDVLWNNEHQMKRGQYVALLLGAANRDPQEFADPDSFQIQRQKNKHLAFGGGAHFCIGAQLSRIEVIAVLNRLLDRFPNLSLLEPDVSYLSNLTFRCRSALRVRL